MLAVCFWYVPEQYAAEEVLVGGFIKVFQNIYQYKREGSFEGWIRRIMLNEALSYLRTNKRVFQQVDLEVHAFHLASEANKHELDHGYILQLVASLPAGYRTVFNLYALEGYSHKEIAQQLNITESTSKSQLSRARSLLQTKLKKYEQETTCTTSN